MSNPTPNASSTAATNEFAAQCGTSVPFEAIQEPGTYVCNWSGHLLRVPDGGVSPAGNPAINIYGAEPLFVTKLSASPFVAVTKARLLAANCNLPVSF